MRKIDSMTVTTFGNLHLEVSFLIQSPPKFSVWS